MVIHTDMSFLFETFYLEKGREISIIQKDMRDFSRDKKKK